MSAPPYMKLFVADYLADTTHLTTREHGAYVLLLMAMWRAGGSLPADDRKLAAISKCSAKEWAEMRPTILEFFKRRGGLLTHKRVAAEIAKYEDISDKRSRARNGTRSEKPQKNSGKAGAFVDQNDDNSGHNQNQSQNQKKSPLPPKGGKPGDGLDLGDEAPAPAGRRKAAKPIPEDFPGRELIDEQQAKAREAGADVDIGYQAERFRNWALGKDARYADWPATWRNWCVRTIREAPKRSIGAAPQAPSDDPWRRRIQTFQANGYWNRLDWGPAPGKPGCTIPAELLEELGFASNLLPFPGRPAA